MYFKFCSFEDSLAPFLWAKQKNNAALAPFFFSSIPFFVFSFFSVVVPESMMLCLTFSFLVLRDRGSRICPSSHFFVVVDIELLLRVDFCMLEEAENFSSPKVSQTKKKGGE